MLSKVAAAADIIPCVAEDYYLFQIDDPTDLWIRVAVKKYKLSKVAAAADVLKLTTRDVCAATGRSSKVVFLQ